MARTSFDGRRKAYYGKTRQDVARRLSAAIEAHRDGLPVPNDRQTFEQFVGEVGCGNYSDRSGKDGAELRIAAPTSRDPGYREDSDDEDSA
jgi:hypothetical protein